MNEIDIINNGMVSIGFGEHAIVVNGQQVDTSYGDSIDAQRLRHEWLETLATDEIVKDCLEIPFDELPDSYFKNGHIPVLLIDDTIPFQGEPCCPDVLTAVDEYGLEPAF